jgi:hypothetical protein
MFRLRRLARLVVALAGISVILMQFTPTEGLTKLCASFLELGGRCPDWFTWEKLHVVFEGFGLILFLGGVVWFFLPDSSRAKLKITGPFLSPDHLGHDRWRIRVRNCGPAAANNVQMRLRNVTPRPRYARWQADYPYEVERVGKTLTDPPSRINRADTEDFEIRTWKGSDGNIYGSLDTKDTPPLYRVVIEADEKWRLEYELTAENARRAVFLAQISVRNGKAIVKKIPRRFLSSRENHTTTTKALALF